MGKRTITTAVLVFALAMVLTATTGCVVVQTVERKDRTERSSVELEGAEEVQVDIEMGVGQLSVSEDTVGYRQLMDAEFEYDIASWKPRVDYDVEGRSGELTIRQPRFTGWNLGDSRYVWDLAFTDEVPLYFDIDMGAGESDFDLSGLDVREFRLDIGAGDITVDLTGEYEHDVDVSINGGAGALTVRLPESIGVRVSVDQGIGEVVANGFRLDGDYYVNDAYDDTDVFIDVDIDTGVGQINLILTD